MKKTGAKKRQPKGKAPRGLLGRSAPVNVGSFTNPKVLKDRTRSGFGAFNKRTPKGFAGEAFSMTEDERNKIRRDYGAAGLYHESFYAAAISLAMTDLSPDDQESQVFRALKGSYGSGGAKSAAYKQAISSRTRRKNDLIKEARSGAGGADGGPDDGSSSESDMNGLDFAAELYDKQNELAQQMNMDSENVEALPGGLLPGILPMTPRPKPNYDADLPWPTSSSDDGGDSTSDSGDATDGRGESPNVPGGGGGGGGANPQEEKKTYPGSDLPQVDPASPACPGGAAAAGGGGGGGAGAGPKAPAAAPAAAPAVAGQADGTAMPGGFGNNAANPNPYKINPKFTSGTTFTDGDADGVGGGDHLIDVGRVDNAEDTLRGEFGSMAATDVIPSKEDQIKSDLRFDMFDTVDPGFGEGSDNKLFVMEQNRDAKIIYSDPMFSPGADIGPEAGVSVSSWKLQRTMPTEKMAEYSLGVKAELALVASTMKSISSSNVLGDDIGYYSAHSSKGLKRKAQSPFEPVINNSMQFHSVKTPCGADLEHYKARFQTDAMRYPRHLSSFTNGQGGPTLNKRRSLGVILR
jgi:hypothetical protein